MTLHASRCCEQCAGIQTDVLARPGAVHFHACNTKTPALPRDHDIQHSALVTVLEVLLSAVLVRLGY
ncbi:MAG: hypothetical protein ABI227_09435 [Rhodanobacter sp.]